MKIILDGRSSIHLANGKRGRTLPPKEGEPHVHFSQMAIRRTAMILRTCCLHMAFGSALTFPPVCGKSLVLVTCLQETLFINREDGSQTPINPSLSHIFLRRERERESFDAFVSAFPIFQNPRIPSISIAENTTIADRRFF